MAADDARRQELTRLVMAAKPASFWLDSRDAPAVRAPLRGEASCDLAVVGGGFGGLWAALLAKEANPGRSVVLIEGSRIGWAASGRNGGFCDASLTHGAANGRERFPAGSTATSLSVRLPRAIGSRQWIVPLVEATAVRSARWFPKTSIASAGSPKW